MTNFQNRYRRKDGSYRWFSWQATWDAGRGLIYAVARDVTAERELERQLRQSLQELGGGLAHFAKVVPHTWNDMELPGKGRAEGFGCPLAAANKMPTALEAAVALGICQVATQ